MGGGDKEIQHKEAAAQQQIPKGYVAVMVGTGGGGEEQQRFVIPVTYLNHPLFLRLLKEAEEEYGFHHDGPLNIPCPVHDFRRVQAMIDKETARHHHHHPGGGNHSWCFKIRA